MSNIKSITPIGKHQTYDLEVDHPDHQFYLANGVLTSNSHATAYAIDSYMCAWLLTHHEEEWLCAYLESMCSNPDDKAKAFSEVRGMGYEIVPIDINYATKSWTVLPGKKLMPSLLSCKGVGEAAVDELIASRPFVSFEDVFWDENGYWKPSKFNKKSLEALIKVGAFGSLDCVGPGKLFDSYKHMYEVMIENNEELKKSPKRDTFQGKKVFYELTRALKPMEEWSRRELVELQAEVFGSIDVGQLVEPAVLKSLREKGVRSIDEFDGKNIYWFVPTDVTVKTTKNKRTYALVNVLGPVGKQHRINVWSWESGKGFEPLSVVIAEVSKNDFGMSTSTNKCRIVS